MVLRLLCSNSYTSHNKPIYEAFLHHSPLAPASMMNSQNCSISTCKNCRFFQTEGRRGGTCEQFGTFTDPAWNACPLAVAAFDAVAEDIDPLAALEHSFTLKLPKTPALKTRSEKPIYSELT